MQHDRRPEAVVFDLDGTLVDSRQDIATAVNHALTAHGFPTRPPEYLTTLVGDGARWLIARATELPYDDPAVDPVFAAYSAYYEAHALETTRPMAAVAHTLTELRALPLAVCTNKPRATTELVLRGLGLSSLFRVVIAAGDLPRLKPDPLPLLTIAERLGVRARELVMVGDGPQDVCCGRAVGAFTVGIQGGLTQPKRLIDSRPDVLLDSMGALPRQLESWGWLRKAPRLD
ncbi:MAG: HAD-IA family hydrolase [Polyangiaceae bacterium]|nr:HAD-IA family hydrolase [Polyangiaceae bacterium]